MIKYKFDEEIKYALHYAKKFNDEDIIKVLESGQVKSPEEAVKLSEFFWDMVVASVEDEESGVTLPWRKSAEFCNEKIMNSFTAYLDSEGYDKEWDDVADQQ